MDKIAFPAIEREIVLRRTVPAHQVLVSFRNDEDAELFLEWLHGKGWGAFEAFVRDER